MKSRILKTKLAEPLKRHLRDEAKSILADRIGVSPQKLTAMIDDKWDYVTRDAIERTADFLELEISQIFELVPVDFWQPIEESKGYLLLRGSQVPTAKYQEVVLPRYDDLATQAVKNFVRKLLPDIAEPPVAEHRQDEEELMEQASTQNCVVIGSPKSSAATEILLSRFFDAEPFNSSVQNRRKIPFGFCWPRDSSALAEGSSLTCSDTARQEVDDRPGIVAGGGIHIPADYKSEEEFIAWKTKEGVDCGLVFVANRPFGTKSNIKLIVLAGFGGIGTWAAAKALVQDFRYLEPVGDEKCVYGIVEAKYRKSAHKDDRELRNFRWRYRQGGHSPIK